MGYVLYTQQFEFHIIGIKAAIFLIHKGDKNQTQLSEVDEKMFTYTKYE
jgi:hypothetical protein